jgi:N,N'-diacetyllegionaminate synthase
MTKDKTLKIRGSEAIGLELQPYVLGEIGTNHNRDIECAKLMVAEIARAGVHCAKFQIYEPGEIVSASVRADDYGLDAQYGDISAQEMFEQYLKTPKNWFPELRALCHQFGIACATTIHGEIGLAWANDTDVDIIKIASMDHNNFPLLEAVVNNIKVPILASFGMAELEDIDRAVEILSRHRHGFGIFHCVAIYPPTEAELRLENVRFFEDRYECLVGFSDHTEGISSAVHARKGGAAFFEKHVTFDRAQMGPDHPFAIEFDELSTYVNALSKTIRGSESMEVSAFMPPSDRETANRTAYLKSVISRRPLNRGEIIRNEDVYLARPGHGIPPSGLNRVIGTKVTRDVPAEFVLEWHHLEAKS